MREHMTALYPTSRSQLTCFIQDKKYHNCWGSICEHEGGKIMTTRKSKSDKPPRRVRASSTLRTQVESLLADGGREKEPNRVTDLQSKPEELTRSRIALERLLAELEEHTPPDRRRSTLELASDVLENPGEWLRTSNTQLGNRRPIDLMGTDEEEKVFDLLHAVDQGLF